MNLLLVNVLLALGWGAVNGEFTLSTLVIGFALGYCCLWLVRPLYQPTRYFSRLWAGFRLASLFLTELVKSCLTVAKQVLLPHLTCGAGIVAIPLDVKSDLEITLLANLITLTPGTLSLHITPDRRILFVHAMSVTDPEALRQDIKSGFERRILEVTR